MASQHEPRQSPRPRAPTTVYRVGKDGISVTRSSRSRVSTRPPGYQHEPTLLVVVSQDHGWQDLLDHLHDLADAIDSGQVEGPADHEAIYGPEAVAA